MKRSTILLAFGLALVSPAIAGGSDEVIAKAMKAFAAGELEKTLELCAGVPDGSAAKPKAFYLEGEARLLLGQHAKAETAFRAVLKLRPQAVPARTGLGKALLGRGKAAEAVAELEKAVEADGKSLDARRTLGEALAEAGRPAAAIEQLKKALKQDRKDPLTCRAVVAVLLGEKKIRDAREIANSLVKATKSEPMGYFLVGMCLDRDGKYDEAIKAYEKALQKDTSFIDAHKNIAIICHAVNPTYRDIPRTKKAFHHYERYFALGGKDEELRKIYLQTKGFLEQAGYIEKDD